MSDNIRKEVRELAERVGWGNVMREERCFVLNGEELMKVLNDGGWRWNYRLRDEELKWVMENVMVDMTERERFSFVWDGKYRSPSVKREMVSWAYGEEKEELKKRMQRMWENTRDDEKRKAYWYVKNV